MRYTVPELAGDIRRLKEAKETKRKTIEQFQSKVYDLFDEDRAIWLSAIGVLAQVDCLLSLAKASAALGTPSCRPNLIASEAAWVDFQELRHPALIIRRDFIPNDVTLGTGERSRIALLTGMSR